MEVEEYRNPELRAMLDEFIRIRDTYVALNAYSSAQDEVLEMEKRRSERMTSNLDKLTKTYLLLQQRHQSTVEDLRKEKEDLQKTIEHLKEQCDHLRLINNDRGGNDDQMYRVQDELEVLKSQLALQEDRHNEDIALLKQQHSDEIQRYKMLLQTGKQNTASSQNTKRGHPRNNAVSRQKKQSLFRWPQLDIEKFSENFSSAAEEPENRIAVTKKRKLFHEDKDAAVDIF